MITDAMNQAAKLFEIDVSAVWKLPLYVISDKLRDANYDDMADEVIKLPTWVHSALEPLKGKTVSALYRDDTKLYFDVGVAYYELECEGDCCSNSWWFRIRGVENLIGDPIIAICEGDAKDVDPEDGLCRQKSDSVYEIGIVTAAGVCWLVHRNSSNGYYGGYLNPAKEGTLSVDAEPVLTDWEYTA